MSGALRHLRARELGLRATNDWSESLFSKLDKEPTQPNFERRGAIYNCEFSPSGSLLVSVGESGRFQLYAGTTGKVICDVPAHDDGIAVARWMNEHVFVTGGEDCVIRVWDARAVGPSRHIAKLRGHRAWVKSCEKLTESVILSSGFDGTVRLWDLNADNEADSGEGNVVYANAGLSRMRLSPGKDVLAVAFQHGFATGHLALVFDFDFRSFLARPRDLAALHCPPTALPRLLRSTVRHARAAAATAAAAAPAAPPAAAASAEAAPARRASKRARGPAGSGSGRRGAGAGAGGEERRGRVLAAACGARNRVEIVREHARGYVSSLAFDPSGRFLLARSDEGADLELAGPEPAPDAHGDGPGPSGAGAGDEGEEGDGVREVRVRRGVEGRATCAVYDMAGDLSPLHPAPRRPPQPDARAFPDRLLFEFADSDTYPDFIKEPCFSGCGRLVASPYANGVRLFSVARRQLALALLNRHESGALTVAFHPHLPLLASGGLDARLLLYSPRL
eukprot:tig00000808_g4390.t1